jgi:hypothetical protein
MKTPMQELMDGFDEYQRESQNDSITIEKLKEVITKEFLPKEKQNIIEASNNSYLNSELIKRSSQNKKVNSVGEQYYNETFKTK